MKVLYVNHTAEVSGGERSLLDLLGRCRTTIEPLLACTAGPLAERAHATRHRRPSAIPGTDGSLKLHPLHTPRAVAEIGRCGGCDPPRGSRATAPTCSTPTRSAPG